MSHDVIPQPTKLEKQKENPLKTTFSQKKADLHIIPDFVLAALG